MMIGAIFIVCILLFRRGVVGELQTVLRAAIRSRNPEIAS